jgi:hypothetical protein
MLAYCGRLLRAHCALTVALVTAIISQTGS